MGKNTVVVSVLADTKQFAEGMKGADSVLAKIAGVGKAAVGIVAGITAGVAALAAGGGIARALSIDTAQTKLKALGYDAQQMQSIMDSALASVKGTAYGLGDAATLASQALAAGIPQGQALTKSLTLVTNTAALAGTSLGEMGSIFQKVWTNGRVGTEELNQLADRGIPIWTTLAGSLGVGVDELRKMVSAGEVTADMFTTALTPAVEGIAGTMGTSFTGLAQNIMAALSRVGAIFAGPAIDAAKPWMRFLIDGLDLVGEKLAPLGEKFRNFLSGITPPDLSEGFNADAFVDALLRARDKILDAAMRLFTGIVDALPVVVPRVLTGITNLIGKIIQFIATSGPSILAGAVQALTGLIEAVAVVLPPLVSELVGMLPELTGALLSMLPTLLAAAVTMFLALVQAIPVILPDLLQAVLDMIPPIIGALVGMIPQIASAGIQLFMSLILAVATVVPSLIEAVTTLLPTILTTITGMLPSLLQSGIDLFTQLVESLPIVLPNLITALVTMGPRITAAIISMTPQVMTAAVTLFVELVKAVPKMWPQLRQALIESGPEIRSALASLGPTLADAGRDLIGGVVRGISSSAGRIADTLLSAARDAVGRFTSFLGIRSPSRLFAGFGVNVIEGLAGGLQKVAPVTRAMAALSGVVGDGFDPRLDASSMTVALAGTLAVGGGGNRYDITVQAVAPSAEVGRAVVEAIADYERAGGRVA